MTTLASTLLALGVLAALILIGAGARLAYTRRDVKRGLLMIVMALVLILNVLILAVPV
jgi:hypothetical protein